MAGLGSISAGDAEERFAFAAGDPASAGEKMTVAVDATELPLHGLLYARICLPVSLLGAPDAPHGLLYPLWIPGTHAPSGPIENLGGLSMRDDRGAPVAWERDARNAVRFLPHLSADAQRMSIDITYIANQPTINSQGVDIESSSQHAIINWNCALLYPEAVPVAEISCSVSVRLPLGWDAATALRESDRSADVRRYSPMSLAEVIDRPLLAGASLQHLVLRPASDGPEVVLHVASSHPGEALGDQAMIAGLRNLPAEAEALFGGSWFPRYDMLLRLGDSAIGLEHGCSSLCGAPLSLLNAGHADEVWSRELMPHEFTHSWVGKNRRPIGMLCRDWQQEPVFDGLWVYEGLTELLGRVLAVRCGLLSPEAWRTVIAEDVEGLSGMPGRHWRSIRDTCRSNWMLRGGSRHHAELRRGQDFYLEGALFWLAVDRRIRAYSAGKRSLDDFCRTAFGPHGDRRAGFSEEQIINALVVQASDDWRTMVGRWIDGLGDLDSDAILGGSGWRIDHVPIDPRNDQQVEGIAPAQLNGAAGMVLRDGFVSAVVSDGPASRAGLAAGDWIISANDQPLTKDRLAVIRALADAVPPHPARLLVYRQTGDPQQFSVELPLAEVMRRTILARVDAQEDGFAALLAAHAVHPHPPAPPALPPTVPHDPPP